MHKLICAAALVVAGLLPTTAQAQTTPPNGWAAHRSGCFAFDPTLSDSSRGFERLATPSNAQRVTYSIPNAVGEPTVVRIAAWRQDCANNPSFPFLMIRFESITRVFGSPGTTPSPTGINVANRDIQIVQGSTTTIAESVGVCASGSCETAQFPMQGDDVRPALSTILVINARDPSVLFRNGLQIRLTGMSSPLTIGGTSGGGGDVSLAGRLNGTFFDPARSGEGIMVDFFDVGAEKGVFVSWYTYDDAGNGLWLVGNAAVAPNATSVDVPMILTTGGRFGPLFNAGNVRRTGWGTINLRFPNCSTTVMRYTRTADGQTGQYTMGRLGLASGVSC